MKKFKDFEPVLTTLRKDIFNEIVGIFIDKNVIEFEIDDNGVSVQNNVGVLDVSKVTLDKEKRVITLEVSNWDGVNCDIDLTEFSHDDMIAVYEHLYFLAYTK